MSAASAGAPDSAAGRIVRHALVDRIFHWVTAASVLVALATAFLPILGVQFAWVTIHWVSGLVLTAAVVFHTVRALLWQRLGTIWVGLRDLREWLKLARFSLRLSAEPPAKPGKYSLAQKLAHHGFALITLVVVVTGLLMLVRIDTPWWQRDPYWLEAGTWGIVYVLHGLAALSFITLIIVHVYFALRPEKLHFLRSMLFGWITREEYRDNHDPDIWQVNR